MEWRSAFVGREREMADVRRLLDGTRLLTLTGPGGIGKTRLAVEAIGAASDRRPRHVVELASVLDPKQLLPAIGAALGVRESSAIDPLTVVSERLGRRETVLLLDNFEQIAGAAPTVGRLLDATPSLRVVVTSRVPLHLSGEQEYPVPPLATPPTGTARSAANLRDIESVRLFLERAHSVRPDFQLTDENATAVAEICRELDGLPLAVELAASRLKVLSPEAILARLGERLALLTGGAADAPARQRTLRATIAWSYDLLPPSERLLFARCAVFVGGFDLDGVQAVSESDEQLLLDAVGLLVDHNLVTASVGSDGEPRFSMLETIREFGLAELSEADVAQTRDGHADFCIQLAESAGSRLQGADHARWLARLNQDVDNIRAARAWLSDRGDSERLCRLAAPMGTYWRYYGSISEGRTWLMEALAGSANAAHSSRAALLMTAGWLDAVGGDVAGGRDLLEQALELFEELGDLRSIADTLYHLGSTLIDLGDGDLATAHVERGLEIAREQGYADLEGRLTYSRAVILSDVDSNRLADRRRLLLAAIDASKRAGDLQRVALSLNHLGGVEWESGDLHAAMEDWKESVRLTREWGERAFLGSLLLPLSVGQLEDGDFEGSRSSLLEGVRITREAGAMPDLIGSLASVAAWLDRVGVADEARATWMTAEHLAVQHGMDPPLAYPLAWVRQRFGGHPPLPGRAPTPGGVPTIEQALDAAELAIQAAEPREPTGRDAASRSPFDLTAREREVLALVVAGRSNAEIGEELFISRKTASVHVANIKDKLAADSRIGIVTIALDTGLVPPKGAAEPLG